ncbi:MAG: site-specific integrase, partial [SAR202 cluster bacterium]|nr:site-specific integrase [SAR202 cluster bacterium]
MELSNIKLSDINLDDRIITVWGKGAKQRVVCYGTTTATYMAEYLDEMELKGNQAIIPNVWVITNLLKELEDRTGIKCNAHSFRRGFATELRRKGLSELDIAELGRWSSTEMVQRYSRAYTFQDAATRYKAIV